MERMRPLDNVTLDVVHPELAQDELLHFAGEGSVRPGGELRVEGRDEGVREEAHRRGGGIEQAEVARVPVMDLVVSESLDDEIDRVLGGEGPIEIDASSVRDAKFLMLLTMTVLPHLSAIARSTATDSSRICPAVS